MPKPPRQSPNHNRRRGYRRISPGPGPLDDHQSSEYASQVIGRVEHLREVVRWESDLTTLISTGR